MKVRIACGIAVLAVMAWIAVGMIPPYLDDLQFRRYLEAVAESPEARTAPTDLLAIRVAQKAAEMGIPLKRSDIKVERSASGVRIDLKYVVPVDLHVYSVDLHFRDSAGKL